MKRRILLIGSIFAVILLILVSFNGVASDNVVERNDMIQRFRDRIENISWYPGEIFHILIIIIMLIISKIINGRGFLPPQ